jgi:hypothetical protein
MKKSILFGLTILFAADSFASDIYGYAIQCRSKDSAIKVSARQSDDDFLFQSVGLSKKEEAVFMESENQYSLSAKDILFVSAEPGNDVTLEIEKTQPNSVNGAKAKGYLVVGNKSKTNQALTMLDCIVRYAKTEEAFDNANLAEWADLVLAEPVTWGGDLTVLTVLGKSAYLKMGCTSASFDKNWVVVNGQVKAKGIYEGGSGIPLPPGHKSIQFSVILSATIKGNKMNFTMTRESGELIKKQQLTRGKGSNPTFNCF